MAHQQELGKRGEELACQFLTAAGYKILARNWRYSRAEIDIVAQADGILVIVEVKTRKNTFFGHPESFVDPRKQRLLAEAAAVFAEQTEHPGEIRFDVVSIVYPPNAVPDLVHLRDAFFPGLA
ncbi:MAG: YraN family protein [Lewinellaceae bacterium]|nr:YraN family protein [Lewinellaceae bacterium]